MWSWSLKTIRDKISLISFRIRECTWQHLFIASEGLILKKRCVLGSMIPPSTLSTSLFPEQRGGLVNYINRLMKQHRWCIITCIRWKQRLIIDAYDENSMRWLWTHRLSGRPTLANETGREICERLLILYFENDKLLCTLIFNK